MRITIYAALLLVMLGVTGCQKGRFTGDMELTFTNVRFVNTEDLEVSFRLFIDPDDLEPLREYSAKNIGLGGSATFYLEDLNYGNYYVAYSAVAENGPWGLLNEVPIQIVAGKTEEKEIEI